MTHPSGELTALLDGALDAVTRAAVEAHLAGCAACRAERDRLAAAIRLLGALPAPPEPRPGFEARFQGRLAAGRRPPRPNPFQRLRWIRLAPALVGAAAAAGLLFYAGASRRADERAIAERLELLENYELVASLDAVESPEDLQVAAHLDELAEGRP